MKKETRIKVWNKYNKRCTYCGKEIEYKDMQVDHFVPQRIFDNYKNKLNTEENIKLFKGQFNVESIDKDDLSNLMPSCRRCNHYKRDYLLENFRKNMQSLHERLEKIYIFKVALDHGIVNINPFKKFYYED